jgi:hypothetical protein
MVFRIGRKTYTTTLLLATIRFRSKSTKYKSFLYSPGGLSRAGQSNDLLPLPPKSREQLACLPMLPPPLLSVPSGAGTHQLALKLC